MATPGRDFNDANATIETPQRHCRRPAFAPNRGQRQERALLVTLPWRPRGEVRSKDSLAAKAEAPALVTLQLAFLHEVSASVADQPALAEALARYFTSSLGSGEFIACTAIAEDQIVATSGLVYHQHTPTAANLSGRQAYVINFYTLPAWCRRGIASALLHRLIVIAKDCRCQRVVLHALPKAGAIYQRPGFIPSESEIRLDL